MGDMRLLALLLLLSGCDQKSTASSCPNTFPAGGGCPSANVECPYDKDGKKWKCTCTPDTSGPSTWQCNAL
jgi:hypothetical protein